MLYITIPQPCHEDWNQMTPTDKGAFCAVCTKEVVDFSKMNDEEVKYYFLNNAGKKTCGRFRKEQVRTPPVIVDEKIIYTNIALWKKFLAAVLICFGALLTNCTRNPKGKILPQNEVETGNTIPGSEKINPECAHLVGDTTAIINQPAAPNVHVVGFSPPVFVPGKPKLVCVEPPDEVTMGVPVEIIQGDVAPVVVEPAKDPVIVVPAKEEPKPIPPPNKHKQLPGDSCTAPVFL